MKNSKLLSTVVAAASTLFVALSASAEYTCDLTFPSAPATALANFPVLVRLAEDAPTGFHYADCPTASCIWFTDENDDAIPCDVDTWDTTGESLVWVSVPSLSSSATITMHWDTAGAPSGQPASSQVWSLANYVGVWHMNEILEDNGLHYTPDASASGWNAYKANEADGYPVTISDAGIANSAPPTGHAMVNQLNDNNRTTGGFIVPASATSGTTIGPFTISFFEATTESGNDRVVGFGTGWGNGCITAGTGNTYVMAPGGYNTFNYSDGLENNAWRHIAGIFDANLAGYVGGAYRNLNKSVSNYSVTLSNGIGLGTFTGHTETFRGNLDEIRIRNVASTGEWIAEEYKTVTTASYVTFGTVETGVEVLRLGAVAVSDVTPTNAVVTGELRTLGEGATSADVWLVYTDGGATTNRIALGPKSGEPSALSVTLENLAEKTTYTCWFTATNNLLAGADSATATFKTKRIPTGTGIYECELSFPSAPATPIENFPVLVRLANDAPEGFLYEDCPTAAHLWFTDGYDTVLPFEADTWNTAGESLVWVSVPSFSSATKITMHWSSDAGSVEDSPAAREVWTRAGYNAVWHFSGSNAESANGLVPSSTSGTPTYNGNANYPGGVGSTMWLDGNSTLEYAVDPAWTTLGEGSTLTVSCWARSTAASPGYARTISCMNLWTDLTGWDMSLQNSFTQIMVGAPNKSQMYTDISPGVNTAWRHFTATYTTTSTTLFVDGVSAKSQKLNALVTPTGNLNLGAAGAGRNGNYWTGGLDEIRIRAAASSSEWIAAEYATMVTANYVSFGDVEGGSGSVEVLRLSTPTVSDITVVSATVSGRLTKFGEGATSASVSLHYTDGGVATNTVALGSTNAVPAVFTAALANLTPSTAYTVWFSAVNNAETPASTNSVATVFSTGADATEWDTATATFTPDGRTISATVDITNVGSGTSTLYLMKGSGDTATVAGFVPVTSSGTKTVVGDFSDLPWGSRVYYSLMLVNGTEANAVTNTYAPSGNAAYKDLQDNSTYTWIGGASGVWNDPTQWNRTAVGDLASEQPAGYPVFGSTAAFAEAAGNDPVTVTIPATPGTSVIESTPPGTSAKSTAPCWVIATLNYANMEVPLTFTSETTDWTSHLHIRGQTQNAAVNLTFDHCAVWINQQRSLGANSVDANGNNSIYTFTHGTVADWSVIYPERPGVAIRVKDGAWLTVGNINTCGVGDVDHPPVIEVEDAELRCAGPLTPDSNGTSGALYRLLGSHPKLEFMSCQTAKDNSTDVVEFFVPVGGYTEPPLHFWGDAVINSSGKANLTLRIAADSPALSAGVATTTRFVNGKVADGATAPKVAFDLPTGVTTSTFTDPNGNADGYVVSIPAGAGPALANVGIASCKDNSFTIAGTLSIATANESATITSYVAEDGGDFAAKGTTTSGGGVFSVKASGLVSGTKYRWYVEAVTPSGSFRTVEQVLTFYPGAAVVSDASVAPTSVDGEKVYVFTDSETPGSITFAKGGLVEVLVVGGGGAGGSTFGGGGGAGAFLYRRDFIPAGAYTVTVGKGGYNTNSSGTRPVAAESSSIGALFVAPGGGAGALLNTKYGTALGGSAGGDCGGNGTAAPLRGIWPFGTDGGATGNSGSAYSPGAGGGGAGGPGSDRRTWGGVQLGGKGGDGVACSITGESVFYAAGGGGGAYNADLLPGAAGLGGVSGSAHGDAERHDAPANTGSGGGGGGPTTTQGGSGGSGIVVIRVKKFDKIGFSIIVR